MACGPRLAGAGLRLLAGPLASHVPRGRVTQQISRLVAEVWDARAVRSSFRLTSKLKNVAPWCSPASLMSWVSERQPTSTTPSPTCRFLFVSTRSAMAA